MLVNVVAQLRSFGSIVDPRRFEPKHISVTVEKQQQHRARKHDSGGREFTAAHYVTDLREVVWISPEVHGHPCNRANSTLLG
ncbi:MAG: hypothetical protein J07HQW2_00664 [Haloquadratum walsbyi J07HQW2]|jgi:hypothetical protein|uniref:Uncharacterized protein n=1 Tax=Haloquadratum walsbyi J07HQW2 TaxID=1238425 RepID=U1NBG8_9EURY|nr:MAG: hypothetical protein J07HQW2_00664 [Haloquadratum walsbyi J07HQW2]